MSNQWPEFDKLPKPKTVRSVLIEEGNGITERTDGEIKFLVESEPSGNGAFLHRCFLVVAKVGYRHPLMRVVQDGLSYPVTVVADIFPQGSRASNDKELRKVLGQVFRSDVVKNLVPQLLELVS
jgi:hypothetical protein